MIKTEILKSFREKFVIELFNEGEGFLPEPKREILWGISVDDLEQFLSTSLDQVREQAEKETAKAYGGCMKCYGKGYATYRHGYRAEADMLQSEEQEDPIETHMIFCTCDRGKQLEALTKLKGEL